MIQTLTRVQEKLFLEDMNHDCNEGILVVEALDPNYDSAEHALVMVDGELDDYDVGVHYPSRSLKFRIRFRSVGRHVLDLRGSRGY